MRNHDSISFQQYSMILNCVWYTCALVLVSTSDHNKSKQHAFTLRMPFHWLEKHENTIDLIFDFGKKSEKSGKVIIWCTCISTTHSSYLSLVRACAIIFRDSKPPWTINFGEQWYHLPHLYHLGVVPLTLIHF